MENILLPMSPRPIRSLYPYKKIATDIFSKHGLWLTLIVLFLLFSVSAPYFLSLVNLFNILLHISIIGIIASGMTFVILTGGIDLSVGSIVALSGVAAAALARYEQLGTIVPVVGGILTGTSVGFLFNGQLISKPKLNPFIVTLASMSVVRGLALIVTGARPIYQLNDKFLNLSLIKVGGVVPIPVVAFLLVFLFAYIFQKYSILARHIYIVGGSRMVAYVATVRVEHILLFVYALSGTLTGLAGVLLASRVGSGNPVVGFGYELNAIAAVIIGGTSLMGGRGGVGKTIIGVLIMGVITNGLNLLNVPSYSQQVIQGFVIVLAVLMDQLRYGKLRGIVMAA